MDAIVAIVAIGEDFLRCFVCNGMTHEEIHANYSSRCIRTRPRGYT